jgi:hypothetical protein
MNDLSYGANTSPASKITTQFTCRPESFCACHLIYDIASEIHIGIAVSILKADRLEAYPTFARVGCEAKLITHPTARSTTGVLIQKNRAPPTGGAQKEGKRVKELKEKGLLLQPPLRHKPA